MRTSGKRRPAIGSSMGSFEWACSANRDTTLTQIAVRMTQTPTEVRTKPRVTK